MKVSEELKRARKKYDEARELWDEAGHLTDPDAEFNNQLALALLFDAVEALIEEQEQEE